MQQEAFFSSNPEIRAAQERFGYADAVVAGDTVYVSGVVAFLAEEEDDVAAALERAFDRLAQTLDNLGLGWENVVSLDTFHTQLKAHSDIFKQVKNRYIKEPFPAWTAVGVSDLARPNAIAEIKLTAWKG